LISFASNTESKPSPSSHRRNADSNTKGRIKPPTHWII
jgi:hypothetical protein